MCLAPCSWDRDDEIVYGEILQVARTAANDATAALRLNISEDRGLRRAVVECSMLASIGCFRSRPTAAL
jgi:hypothetical protein